MPYRAASSLVQLRRPSQPGVQSVVCSREQNANDTGPAYTGGVGCGTLTVNMLLRLPAVTRLLRSNCVPNVRSRRIGSGTNVSRDPHTADYITDALTAPQHYFTDRVWGRSAGVIRRRSGGLSGVLGRANRPEIRHVHATLHRQPSHTNFEPETDDNAFEKTFIPRRHPDLLQDVRLSCRRAFKISL